jgi:hypothetical protein
VLRQEPGNVTASRLLSEIDAEPQTLLGSRSHAYVVRDSDTMSDLAQRFLGDPLLFYALARYNNLAPNDLAPGSTIQIPDHGRTTPVAARPPASAPRPDAAPATATAAPGNAADIARASHLRLQALEHLNAGDADTAVTLLRQARTLDTANPAIQSDLNRAQRIQASLHTP